jgi:hypothetical protein
MTTDTLEGTATAEGPDGGAGSAPLAADAAAPPQAAAPASEHPDPGAADGLRAGAGEAQGEGERAPPAREQAAAGSGPQAGAAPSGHDRLPAAKAFLERSLDRVRDNLEMLLGESMTVKLGDPVVFEPPGPEQELPADGVGIVCRSGPEDPEAVLIMDTVLVQVILALSRMADRPEIALVRQEPPALDAAALEALQEPGEFISAALAEEIATHLASGRTRRSDGSCQVRLRSGGAWDEHGDPLSGGLRAPVEFVIGDTDPLPCSLFLPDTLLEFLKDPPDEVAESRAAQEAQEARLPRGARAPEPRPVRSGERPAKIDRQRNEETAPDGPLAHLQVSVVAGPETLALLREAYGDHLRAEPGLAGLIAGLDEGRVPDVLFVEVDRNEDHVLGLAAATRSHPAFRGHPIVILLQHPTRTRVLKCARAGLMRVLPGGVAAEVLRRYLRVSS